MWRGPSQRVEGTRVGEGVDSPPGAATRHSNSAGAPCDAPIQSRVSCLACGPLKRSSSVSTRTQKESSQEWTTYVFAATAPPRAPARVST